MDDIKKHIDDRFELLHSDMKDLSGKFDVHREEYLREVTELKTKVSFFKQWMTGLAAFIGAAFSAIVDYLGKH